jgi:hypothetical protein
MDIEQSGDEPPQDADGALISGTHLTARFRPHLAAPYRSAAKTLRDAGRTTCEGASRVPDPK